MATTTGGADAGSTPPATDTDPHTPGHALMPLTQTRSGFPAPDVLAQALADGFEESLAQKRRERGTVYVPEDTHATIRDVHAVKLLARRYADVFLSLDKRAGGALAEELVEAVHEQQGIPLSGMKVPDGEATIVFTLEKSTVRDFDMPQIYRALAQLVMDEHDEGAICDDEDTPEVLAFAVECIERAVAELLTGSKPSIKGIEALQATAGHRGADDLAATVRTAVGPTRRPFKGVKVEHKPAA